MRPPTRRNRADVQTDTPPDSAAFRRWFGNSKVVDAKGRPRVVYHGTADGGFVEFEHSKIDKHHSGFFFTSSKEVAESYGMPEPLPRRAHTLPDLRTVADVKRFVNSPENDFDGWRIVLGQSQQIVEPEVEDYGLEYTGMGAQVVTRFFPFWARNGATVDIGGDYYPPYTGLVSAVREAVRRGGPATSGVYPVYLRLLNPMVVEGRGALWSDIPFERGVYKTDQLSAIAKQRGYDGVIFRDIYDSMIAQDVVSDVYVAFDPRQIKSAVANVGTYDPESADIRMNPTRRSPTKSPRRRNPSAPYTVGEKYFGPVSEVRYLPVSAIYRAQIDFRPETLRVSDRVAQQMDFTEPVDVVAYRSPASGWAPVYPPRMWYPTDEETSDHEMPVVTLTDGHHRLAAAIQTGREWLPVSLKSVNARGEKLNALVALSREIEALAKTKRNPRTRYVYHLTYASDLPAIARQGLVPRTDTEEAWDNEPGVYFVNAFGYEAGAPESEEPAWLRFPAPDGLPPRFFVGLNEAHANRTFAPETLDVWVDERGRPAAKADGVRWSPLLRRRNPSPGTVVVENADCGAPRAVVYVDGKKVGYAQLTRIQGLNDPDNPVWECEDEIRTLRKRVGSSTLWVLWRTRLDDAHKNKGYGVAMYEALLREMHAQHGKPAIIFPEECVEDGNTSEAALRVWASLMRRWESEGRAVASIRLPESNPRKRR